MELDNLRTYQSSSVNSNQIRPIIRGKFSFETSYGDKTPAKRMASQDQNRDSFSSPVTSDDSDEDIGSRKKARSNKDANYDGESNKTSQNSFNRDDPNRYSYSSDANTPPQYSGFDSDSQTNDPNANPSGASVRSIPCYYADCTYSYKRPGSTFAELSDRRLILPSPKFDNIIIRACKKHHDKWKMAEENGIPKDSCEICRGFNMQSVDDLSVFVDGRGFNFNLCNFCSQRQEGLTGIRPQSRGSPKKLGAPKRKASRYDEDFQAKNSDSESDFHESDMELDAKNDEAYEREMEEEETARVGPRNVRDSGGHVAARAKLDGDYKPIPEKKGKAVAHEKTSTRSSPGKKAPSTNNNNNRRRKGSSSGIYIYTLYQRNCIEGWETVSGMTYAPMCQWDDEVVHLKPSIEQADNNNLNVNVVSMDKESPFVLAIKRIGSNEGLDSLGVFTQTEILENQTIGEYTGRVTEVSKDGPSEFSFRISHDLQIESNELGNEVSLINKESPGKEPNVRFDVVGGHVLAVATRRIEPGDELIGDYAGSEYRDRESSYLEIFAKIDEHNRRVLTDDERDHSAFQWFLDEGIELLKGRGKGKITVPITHRIPSKKGLASNLAPKRYSHVTKDQSEWGYVAQYELLDLERAREDCWVTFKAGRNISWEDLDRAVTTWKSDPEKFAAAYRTANPESEKTKEEIVHHPIARSPDRAQVVQAEHPKTPQPKSTRKSRTDQLMEHEAKALLKSHRESPIREVSRSGDFLRESTRNQSAELRALDNSKQSDFQSSQIKSSLQEINFKELSIKYDAQKDLIGSGRSGHVFKGYWRGYPIAARFPLKPTDEAREIFLSQCNSLTFSHPNLIQCFGLSRKEQLCMVMELMNVGNLKKHVMSMANITTHAQIQYYGMYIPRIALDIARGMEFLHSKGIVHRNLKSSNVLMKGEMLDDGLIANLEVKISDYGMDNENALQLSNKDMEYLYFFAPEVLENRRHTPQSDVFSFGMILCHMFSEGQEKPRQPSIVMQTSSYLQRWDPRWKELITRCTDRDPNRRPSFTMILDTLCELLAVATRDYMQ